MIAMSKRIRNYALSTLLMSVSAIFLSGQVNGDTIAPRYRTDLMGVPFGIDLVFKDVTDAESWGVYAESTLRLYGINGVTKGDFNLQKFTPPGSHWSNTNYIDYVLTKKGSDQNLLANMDFESTMIRSFSSSGQVIGTDFSYENGDRTEMHFLLDPMTGVKKYFDSSFYPASLNKDGVIIGMWNRAPAIMQSFDSDPELLLPLIRDSFDLTDVDLEDINDFGRIVSTGRAKSYGGTGNGWYYHISMQFEPIAPAPVPEPSTFIVIGSGLVLAWIRRHRIVRNQESNE